MKDNLDAYILTASGRKFFFHDPSRGGFRGSELAGPLSRICRFTGHTREFYSVAQHSVSASHLVNPEFALEALLHDGSEAFLTDISAPLKDLLPDYQKLEHSVQSAICEHFRVPGPPMSAPVRYADLIMLATERRDLLPATDDEWPCLAGIYPLEQTVIPMTSPAAEAAFMARFNELVTYQNHY